MMLNFLKDTCLVDVGPAYGNKCTASQLKFSIDVEVEGKLPVLDLCINHLNDKLISTWYCKPLDTGLIINFHTLAPSQY